jgi:hypothetical protein
MLDQETKDKLESLGFDVSKLTDAVKSESEQSLDVPNLKTEEEFKGMLSDEDRDAFGRNRFEEGKRAFSEIKAKEYKEKYGVSIDGKDLDKVVEAHIEAKIKESSTGNTDWINEKKKLQESISEAESKLAEKDKEYKQKLFNIEVRTDILNNIPNEVTTPKEDIADLFLLRHRVAQEDGRTVYYKGDEKLQDKKLDPLGTKDLIASFIDERKYIPNGGMGGSGGSGAQGGRSTVNFKKLSEFQEWCKTQEGELSNPMSPEAQKVLAERKDKQVSFEEFTS